MMHTKKNGVFFTFRAAFDPFRPHFAIHRVLSRQFCRQYGRKGKFRIGNHKFNDAPCTRFGKKQYLCTRFLK